MYVFSKDIDNVIDTYLPGVWKNYKDFEYQQEFHFEKQQEFQFSNISKVMMGHGIHMEQFLQMEIENVKMLLQNCLIVIF